MLLPIPIYRPVASQFFNDVIFASVRVTLTQTPESVLRHSWPVIRTVDTARVQYVIIKSHKYIILLEKTKKIYEQYNATFNSFLNFLCLYLY